MRTPFLLLVSTALPLLLAPGCRRSSDTDAPPPQEAFQLARTVTRIDLGNVSGFVVPSPSDEFCSQRDSQVVCKDKAGDSLAFQSWSIAAGESREGDLTWFKFQGRFSPMPDLRVILAELGHDAPIHLLWDPRTGRFATIALNYDPTWISRSGRTLLIVPDSSDRNGAVQLLTNLDDHPIGWRCGIAKESIVVDSLIYLHHGTPGRTAISPEMLSRHSLVDCREDTDLWGRAVPDYADRSVALEQFQTMVGGDTNRTAPP